MRRAVSAAAASEARYPSPDPIAISSHTTSVHPEITSGAVLPG